MKIKEQIEIIKELIEGVEELNGSFQEGWERDIEKGYDLLEYLESKIRDSGSLKNK